MMGTSRRYLAAATLLAFLPLRAAVADPTAEALSWLDRLVGGRWVLGDTHQTFEWDLDRRTLRARSFVTAEGTEKQVAFGMWYWHPGERAVRAVFTAIDMPVSLLEYSTSFEGETMVSEVHAWDDAGTPSRYRETWEFVAPDRFEWTLFEPHGDGYKIAMRGIYDRRR